MAVERRGRLALAKDFSLDFTPILRCQTVLMVDRRSP